MTLENWAQNAWLKRQPTSPQELTDLLKIVERDLHDCESPGISAYTQFTIAFNAALQAATAALRASGYRTAGQGHHVRVIDSLALTIVGNHSEASDFRSQAEHLQLRHCRFHL